MTSWYVFAGGKIINGHGLASPHARLSGLLADLLDGDGLAAFEIDEEEPDDAEIFDLHVGLHVAERHLAFGVVLGVDFDAEGRAAVDVADHGPLVA